MGVIEQKGGIAREWSVVVKHYELMHGQKTFTHSREVAFGSC